MDYYGLNSNEVTPQAEITSPKAGIAKPFDMMHRKMNQTQGNKPYEALVDVSKQLLRKDGSEKDQTQEIAVEKAEMDDLKKRIQAVLLCYQAKVA